MSPRAVFWHLVDCFRVNNILTYASAIAFQLLVALVPLAALTLLLIGLFGAGSLWFDHWQPTVNERVTPETYLAISSAVDRVLAKTNLVWVGLGSALTIWEVSGSVRAVMGALNQIYGEEEDRPIWARFGLSILLACGVIALTLGALALIALWGLFLLPVTIVMLWLMMAMLIRLAPAAEVEVRWVTVGSVLVVVFWIAASFAYGLYVRNVADFESTFGFVAAGLVLTGYLYASSIVFLLGAQLDELLRKGKIRLPTLRPGRGDAG